MNPIALSGLNPCDIELSILMPCLNEAETLAACVEKAHRFLSKYRISGEVIVADNGSNDGSPKIAESRGARIVSIPRKGYGSALLGGIKSAKGRFIIMGDADDSYNFAELMPFVQKLREGHDLVMGNRFRGGIESGAMPFLHRYLGNPVLSWLGKLFFKSPCNDFHCGLRGFKKSSIESLRLETSGMEFASEMVVKATLQGLSITEVPTTLSPDGRSRAPHLRTWRDGWRHLKFLLLHSPCWLFWYPGLSLMALGTAVFVTVLPAPFKVGTIYFDVHTLLYAASFILLGYQAATFALFAESYGIGQGYLPPNKKLEKRLSLISVDRGALIGLALICAGLALGFGSFHHWQTKHFGPLDVTTQLRSVIASVLLLTLGTQTIFSSFFLSTLRKPGPENNSAAASALPAL